MTAHAVQPGDVLTLQLVDSRESRTRCPEMCEALIDSAAIINWRAGAASLCPR
jgi:hypothetical protein